MLGWNETAWFSIFMSAALKSTVVLGAAWLAAWALGGQSAALRHLLWTAAVAALLALPFLSAALPVRSVPAPGALVPFDPAVVFQVASSAAHRAAGVSSLRARRRPPRDGCAARPTGLGDLADAAVDRRRGGGLRAHAGGMHRHVARQAPARSPPDDRGLAPRWAGGWGFAATMRVLDAPAGNMPMTFGFLRSRPFFTAAGAGER